MTAMIERVARAIQGCDPSAGATYEQAARAAIEAMRVPTACMVDVGYSVFEESYDPGHCYTTMITAALEETQ